MEVDMNNEVVPNVQPNIAKRRKKKSSVMKYFTIETVSDRCRIARCKKCKESFIHSIGSKVARPNHLKCHLAMGKCLCKEELEKINQLKEEKINQLTPFTAPPKIISRL